MYLSTDDDKAIYRFALQESTAAPSVSTLGDAGDDITGIAVYLAKDGKQVLFVAEGDKVEVYKSPFELVGIIELDGLEDIEIQGLSIHQASSNGHQNGVLAFAVESEEATGFGLVDLGGPLAQLGISPNTRYNPAKPNGRPDTNPVCQTCSGNGFCGKSSGYDKTASCSCFSGFTGPKCNQFICKDNCSGKGECVGPDMCKCSPGWGGLHCSFLVVPPSHETTANGGDGDDPAIWISPVSRNQSRIITTTKSEEGAGLGVFDLQGTLLQTIPAEEPNNVDVIYGFELGDRKVDLAFAACRGDDTLWYDQFPPQPTAPASSANVVVVKSFRNHRGWRAFRNCGWFAACS
jgi:3-phytase